MKQRLFILTGILFVFAVISFLWWEQAIKPVNPTNKTQVTFTVRRDEGTRSIAERLQKEGIIRSSVAFFLLARFGGLADNIQAGDFRLNPAMNLHAVANIITHGTEDVWIMIPEGWRKEEIALKLTQELGIPETEFVKSAKEGYMFPDTYLVPKDATGGAVVQILLTNFNKKVTQEIKERLKQKALSLDEAVIIASLIEREAKFREDRPLVASVILNRLKNGMKLDIDASIQYALDYQSDQKSWWKKDLTFEDLEIDSPYNTYKNPGLPPTSISNPGLAAIEAVVDATKTDYIYYISDKSGKIHFAKTIEEHNSNIAKYLNR